MPLHQNKFGTNNDASTSSSSTSSLSLTLPPLPLPLPQPLLLSLIFRGRGGRERIKGGRGVGERILKERLGMITKLLLAIFVLLKKWLPTDRYLSI